MQHEFVAGDGGVGRREGGDDARDGVHDPLPEIIRLGIAAVDLPLVGHQRVDALGQTGHAKHGQEAVGGKQALLHEEVGLEEAGLLDDEADALVHVIGDEAKAFGQKLPDKLLLVHRLLDQLGQGDAGEGVGPAADRQDVVAAGHAVTVEGGAVGHVVADGRVGAGERALNGPPP